MKKCPICLKLIMISFRAQLDYDQRKISLQEAERRSLISHARHEHTNYEQELRKKDPDALEKARIQDHFNDIARKKLGLRKRRHSWEAKLTGEDEKQRRLL